MINKEPEVILCKSFKELTDTIRKYTIIKGNEVIRNDKTNFVSFLSKDLSKKFVCDCGLFTVIDELQHSKFWTKVHKNAGPKTMQVMLDYLNNKL